MLTLWGYFEGYRNRDPKHNVRQASYRNRNTTWDRYQTGIETQRGTGWLWGFKREPYSQRGPTYTSCRRGFKWESRPNVGGHQPVSSIAGDPPCRDQIRVKPVENSNVFPLAGCGSNEKGCQLRCRPRHLTVFQNYEIHRQKLSSS
ncbi:hypothetical protein TNCV_3736831 [Trichonephila clavipes]|nr:hypothetical protein TNCV_3736831 [Trichonephila clavipes]